MTPAEFHDLCARHDWTYDYSDDMRVWRRGSDERRRLAAIAATDSALKEIFDAWYAHVFSGPVFGTEKQPRPERPAEAAAA